MTSVRRALSVAAGSASIDHQHQTHIKKAPDLYQAPLSVVIRWISACRPGCNQDQSGGCQRTAANNGDSRKVGAALAGRSCWRRAGSARGCLICCCSHRQKRKTRKRAAGRRHCGNLDDRAHRLRRCRGGQRGCAKSDGGNESKREAHTELLYHLSPCILHFARSSQSRALVPEPNLTYWGSDLGFPGNG